MSKKETGTGWLGTVLYTRGRPHGRRRNQRFPLPLYHDPFSKSQYDNKLKDGLKLTTIAFQREISATYTLHHDTSIVGPSVFIFHPGLGSGGLFIPYATQQGLILGPYPDHIETPSKTTNILGTRIVSSGIQITKSSTDEFAGSWEAIRVSPVSGFFHADGNPPPPTTTLRTYSDGVVMNAVNTFFSNSSPQSGTIEDLAKMQFKLNSTTVNHPFKNVSDFYGGSFADFGEMADVVLDQAFDVIMIKLWGNQDVANPTTIDVTIKTNFEKYINESETPNPAPTFPSDLAKTVQPLPGALISDQYVFA